MAVSTRETLAISKKKAYAPVLAFDFGGTKLAAAVIDSQSGEIIAYQRQRTPAKQGAQASFDSIVQAGQTVLAESGVDRQALLGIGISFGGPVSDDRQTVVRSLHIQNWDQVDLPNQLSTIFDCPAYMENDGNAAALGEWRFGKGCQAGNMLYIQVSTGIGSGLIVEHKLYRGSGLAGEFGHLTILPDGPECVCGKYGCVESLSSGWAIARDGRLLLDACPQDGVLNQLCQGDSALLDAEIVIKAYRRGDPSVKPLVEQAFTYLGVGIANAISLLDPQIVVLGGGITRSQDVMQPILEDALKCYCPPMFLRTPRFQLEFSTLNGMETLLGASQLPLGD
jgi:glucokinase